LKSFCAALDFVVTAPDEVELADEEVVVLAEVVVAVVPDDVDVEAVAVLPAAT
jgi:hypothetical protein